MVCAAWCVGYKPNLSLKQLFNYSVLPENGQRGYYFARTDKRGYFLTRPDLPLLVTSPRRWSGCPWCGWGPVPASVIGVGDFAVLP